MMKTMNKKHVTTIKGLCYLAQGMLIALLLGVLWVLHQQPQKQRTSSLQPSPSRDDSNHRRLIENQIRYQHHFPIILMGLPYSGSLAIHEYFVCRGMVSRHYCCCGGDDDSGKTNGGNHWVQFPCCLDDDDRSVTTMTTCGECVLKNMKEGKDPFEESNCRRPSSSPPTKSTVQVWSSFDVETRDEWFLPQHFAIGLLHQSHPNATWVLNKRSSSTKWAESILHWHSKTWRIFASYNQSLYPHPIPDPPDVNAKVTTEEIIADMDNVLTGRVYNMTDHARKLDVLVRIYDDHTNTIRRWADQFPSHNLVELNVDDDNVHDVIGAVLNHVEMHSDTKDGTNEETACKWTFKPPDDEWSDYQLPFLS